MFQKGASVLRPLQRNLMLKKLIFKLQNVYLLNSKLEEQFFRKKCSINTKDTDSIEKIIR